MPTLTGISLKGLVKEFGEATAVADLNLEIEDGELCVFVGPSGCGKTTTLRMIAGFEAPSAGDIRFGGRLVTEMAPEARNIGIVFQNYALFPHMDVFHNVSFGLQMRRVPKVETEERVKSILDKMQLGHLGARYPRQLSGGQQQRTALARALVTNPEVLLLDEPLANLDAKLREEMRIYIRDLQQDLGITTIFVTHDQSEAMAIADRIAIMLDGVLQQYDVPEVLYRHPANLHAGTFIGHTNILRGKVINLESRVCTIATQYGDFRAAAAEGLKVGQEGCLSIRPESLHLTNCGTDNSLTGVVHTKTYLGTMLHYEVEIAPNEFVRVQAPPAELHSEGDSVTMRFSTGDAWALAQ